MGGHAMKMPILAAFIALASTPAWAQTDQQSSPAQPGGGPAMGEMMQGMPEQCRAVMQTMPSSCMEMMQGAMMRGMRGHAAPTSQTGSAGMTSPDIRRHGRMRGRAVHMKVVFALVDTDGDGALSFEEITAVHRRIFNTVDASKDGKVSPEELQTFMQE
jgi:hypothetical protein